MPHVIVLGNEKGGTGKSTVSMHIIAYLLNKNYKVGSIDVDARQGTLTRYLENRKTHQSSQDNDIKLSQHYEILTSNKTEKTDAENEDKNNFENVFSKLENNDFIIIDTPGNNTFLSKLAHSYANMVITPINDSYIDLDMIVRIDSEKNDVLKPSLYSETVWQQKKERAKRDRGKIDWIVILNRKSALHSKYKSKVYKILLTLSKRIGFQLTCGFSERIIFRELFLKGLTLCDMKKKKININLSHIAARNELEELIKPILESFLNQKKVA